jgi:hypothetical protein
VDEGAVLDRTLVVYNDECRDTSVTIEAEIRVGAKAYATGKKTVELPLGEHVDIPCSFQVPNVGGSQMDLVLRTHKGGAMKFEEAKSFRVKGAGRGQATDRAVTFGEPRKPELLPRP